MAIVLWVVVSFRRILVWFGCLPMTYGIALYILSTSQRAQHPYLYSKNYLLFGHVREAIQCPFHDMFLSVWGRSRVRGLTQEQLIKTVKRI
ncbi:hypothetical protein P167DRAFT_37574 [Morchella conica CCBAS932]|uniref:Uncharacterized protein n=1 Tax=Morchella conica CCBAS932 TaxID=1392247 RepID=A0A3N4K8C5_9PEZI|nr:hypothetical protein P167DRAFT_37574 [Morchella conica CCBAS932]